MKTEINASYPRFGSLYVAVFNCRPTGMKKGREAVLSKFGEKGWRKVKSLMKTGIMELFQHSPTPETVLYASVVGQHAEKYWSKHKQPAS